MKEIKQIIKFSGKSVQQVATEAKADVSYIYKLIEGKRRPGMLILEKIADVCGFRVEITFKKK